jgi:hypothetical protein
LADYLVSTLMIKIDEINHDINEESSKLFTNIVDANEHLFIDITNPNSRSSGMGAHHDSR